MSKKVLLLFAGLFMAFMASAQNIQSPSEFLGYELGAQFTNHSRLVDYFKYVAGASKQVDFKQYGTTNEGRPLMAMFIASADNIKKLTEIRWNNLALAGLTDTKPVVNTATSAANAPVIVWLSYNVHGNEPSSTEAAMQTLFDMVDTRNTKTQQWLKNTVVVIDPCLNPDGRERYVDFYNSAKGAKPDTNPSAREHAEPWPQGRTNHYYFDLNRDWAWQTQRESKARMELYNSWLPQIHVDFHEQSYNAPYYFAPAAEPFHKDITPWQKEFQTTIGKNNAKYFDQNGWLYFTKEEFDLLYPSYGDTYPIYNGSIGMTYEQGGIGAGLAITTHTGEVLTLKDRLAHHHSNSLSTVETASANADKAVAEFKKYFDNSRTNPTGQYKGYVIKNDNDDKARGLTNFLKANDIQYNLGAKATATGYNYFTGKTERFDVDEKDIVISAYQPKSVLLNVLFEPKTFVADSNTYDITAWSLPYVYGMRAYGLNETIKSLNTAKGITTIALPPQPPAGTVMHAYAYVAKWQSLTNVRFLAELFKNNIKVRYAEAPFEAAGRKFEAGSLIITRAGNIDKGLDNLLLATAYNTGVELTPLSSGFVDKGVDLGSASVHLIKPPKVMLVSGESTSAEAMGEVWHYFEKQIDYPVTLINYENLGRAKLSDFDVVIFPNGNYDGFPSERLQGWVADGGKLIVLQDAVAQLAGKKGFDIKGKEADTTKNKPSVKAYADRIRSAIKTNVPGAIYKIDIDNTHPLGFGFPNYYYTLKLSNDIYDLLGDNGWNVGTVRKDGYVAGFVGENSKQRLKNGLLLGVQSLGRGAVVYMVDDPLFRSFWENGKLLFSNAVFMVGQ
ncbi:MAG: M14 family metallopeptidase [Bacteroidota bacterium]